MEYKLNNVERNHYIYERIKKYLSSNKKELFENSSKNINFIVGTINPSEDQTKIIISKFEEKYSKKKVLGIIGKEKMGLIDYVKIKHKEGNISAVISKNSLENLI